MSSNNSPPTSLKRHVIVLNVFASVTLFSRAGSKSLPCHLHWFVPLMFPVSAAVFSRSSPPFRYQTLDSTDTDEPPCYHPPRLPSAPPLSSAVSSTGSLALQFLSGGAVLVDEREPLNGICSLWTRCLRPAPLPPPPTATATTLSREMQAGL